MNDTAKWVKFKELPAALRRRVQRKYWKGLYYPPLYYFPLTGEGKLAKGVNPISIHKYKKLMSNE